MSAAMTPAQEAIMRQWEQHNPFQRAAPDLIRKVQRVQREINRNKQPQGETAPF